VLGLDVCTCSSVRSRSIPSYKFQEPSRVAQKSAASMCLTNSYVRAHPHTLHLTPSWPDLLSNHPFCHLTQRAPTQHLQGTAGHVRVCTNPKKIQFEDSCNKCSLFVGRGPTSPHHTSTAAAALKTSRPKHLGYGLDTGRFRLSV